MTIKFQVRENKNWYRAKGINNESLRYEVILIDDGEYSATMNTYSTRAEADASAADRQADEDAGVTIRGMNADDHHALENGLATPLREYYDARPELVAQFGHERASDLHPWRASIDR